MFKRNVHPYGYSIGIDTWRNGEGTQTTAVLASCGHIHVVVHQSTSPFQRKTTNYYVELMENLLQKLEERGIDKSLMVSMATDDAKNIKVAVERDCSLSR